MDDRTHIPGTEEPVPKEEQVRLVHRFCEKPSMIKWKALGVRTQAYFTKAAKAMIGTGIGNQQLAMWVLGYKTTPLSLQDRKRSSMPVPPLQDLAYDKLSDEEKATLRDRPDMVDLQRRALRRALDAELAPDARLARLRNTKLVRQGPPKFFWLGSLEGPNASKEDMVKWFRTDSGEWDDMIEELRGDGWDDEDLWDYLLPATDPNFAGVYAWDEVRGWIDEDEAYFEIIQQKVASDPDIKVGDWAYVFPIWYPSRPYHGLGRVGIGGDGNKRVFTDEGEDPSAMLPDWARQDLARQGTFAYPGKPMFEMTDRGLRLVFDGEQVQAL